MGVGGAEERKIRKEETRGKIIKKRGDLLNNKRDRGSSEVLGI